MADRPALIFGRPLAGRSILCLGLGGGSDALSACLVAKILEANGAAHVRYGNTRAAFDAHVTPLSPRIGRLEGPREHPIRGNAHGTTLIDRSLPKGPGGSPLVVRLDARERTNAEALLAPEIDALGCDLIVGVDTGGDVLSRHKESRNRDRIMLRAILASRAEVWVAVLGPGSDGSPLDKILPELTRARADAGYLGTLDLEPWAPLWQELSEGLDDRRTPRLILSAIAARASGQELPMEIPRGARPHVPLSLLCAGFFFEGSSLLVERRDRRPDDP